MEKRLFGKTADGRDVHAYTLKNSLATLTVLDFGAIINDFRVFGRSVIGGFDDFSKYIADTSHQGATIGRTANRVENAEFTMDGKVYKLPKNNGENNLHGGEGFDRRMFTLKDSGEDFITLEYISADGEEGFPSEVKVEVRYTLIGSAFAINMTATPSGKTPISMTNHSYFNLDGFGGDILSHEITLYADRYTAVREDLIPNGERPNVKGTVFDLTHPTVIGKHVGENFLGYDHNFFIKSENIGEFLDTPLPLCAVVTNSDTKLSVYTDQPCVQFYIGNFLSKAPDFRGGVKAIKHGAFCLETQTEPNSINLGEGFYKKGEVYRHMTVYAFERKSR